MKNYWDYFWPKVTMCSWLMRHIHKGGGGGGRIYNWNPETWKLLKNSEYA